MKPARSKHCKVCDVCIDQFDHHCIWLNKCVAKNNIASFLLFGFYHGFICFYGSYLIFMVNLGNIRLRYSANLSLLEIFSFYELLKEYLYEYFYSFFPNHTFCAIMGLILFSLSIALPVFMCFHLRNLKVNTTTNEISKRKQLLFGFKNKLIFLRSLKFKSE